MSEKTRQVTDKRGVVHAFTYYGDADFSPDEESQLGLKTWDQVVADVKRLGVPLCNLSTSRGWNYDYGFPWVDKEGRPLQATIDGLPDEAWVEFHGWRVFAELDTGAGLARTDDGEFFSIPWEQARTLEQVGWQYEGSAGYRVEVFFDSIPVAERAHLRTTG